MFLGHRPLHFQPPVPHIKYFIAFTLKMYFVNDQWKLGVICCHFLGCLVVNKVRNFWKFIVFIYSFLKKISPSLLEISALENFYCIFGFTLKNRLNIKNCQFSLAIVCRHFVD